ncbi:MAG: DbpA RNA binding domain-containing protein, partial [Saprospiraceae bacterium]|nr:DbpA RNA binding domain-containing protein [Saprospiraceae bacterium]
IIHYQIPHTEQAFIHRNGRTARMKAEGTAFLIMKNTDRLPEYITNELSIIQLPEKPSLPSASEWTTLRFPYGRKEKINKVDIVGLLHQKAKLEKDDLGLIEVSDHAAFAAVKTKKVKNCLHLLSNEKIKNKLVKVEVV